MLPSFRHLVLKFLTTLKSLSVQDSVGELQRSDVLLICADADRSWNLDGKHYSPLLDGIAEVLESRGLVCAAFSYGGTIIPRSLITRQPFTANRQLYIARWFDRIQKGKNNVKSVFRAIFAKASCKLIITIDAPIELCEAAHEENIVVAEMLHGIGYHTVPWGWDKRKPEALPDLILVTDKVSEATFRQIYKDSNSILRIPNPSIYRFLYDAAGVPAQWKARIGRPKAKRILFAMQWGYLGEVEYFPIIKNGIIFENILDLMKKRTDVDWLFRLHPVQVKESKYRFLKRCLSRIELNYPHIQWRDVTKLPLPTVLENTDGLLTLSSMVCYEAAMFGVKSLLICPSVSEGGGIEGFASDLIKEGYAQTALPTVSNVSSWLDSVERSEPRTSEFFNQEVFNQTINRLEQLSR